MRRSGFSLLYAALDQGNRLDWLNSGLINALLLGGIVLLVARSSCRSSSHRGPGSICAVPRSGNIPLLFLLITFFRFAILSTSYIIPQFLTTVQDYRAIEIGGVLLWIALPQFLLAPVIGDDPALSWNRALPWPSASRSWASAASWRASSRMTGSACDFLPSQIVQAMGQSIGLTSLVWFFLRHLEPSEVLTFGAVLQTGRLFGAQLGAAFIQTFVRVREQVYSNLVGLHVTTGSVGDRANGCRNMRRPSRRARSVRRRRMRARPRCSPIRCRFRPMCWPISTASWSSASP